MATLGETIDDVMSRINELQSLIENESDSLNLNVESINCTGIIVTDTVQTNSLTIFDELVIAEISFSYNIISLSSTSTYNELIIRADKIVLDSEGTGALIQTTNIDTENITIRDSILQIGYENSNIEQDKGIIFSYVQNVVTNNGFMGYVDSLNKFALYKNVFFTDTNPTTIVNNFNVLGDLIINDLQCINIFSEDTLSLDATNIINISTNETYSQSINIGNSYSYTYLYGNIATEGNSSLSNLLITDYISITNSNNFLLESRNINLNHSHTIYILDFVLDGNINYFGNSLYNHELNSDDYIYISNSNIFIDDDGNTSIDGVQQISIHDTISYLLKIKDVDILYTKSFNLPRYIGVNNLDNDVIKVNNTTYFGTLKLNVVIICDSSSTFKYSLNGGISFIDTEISISTSDIYYLDSDEIYINVDPNTNGIQITFSTSSGLSNGDMWEFDCCKIITDNNDFDNNSSTTIISKLPSNSYTKKVGITVSHMDDYENPSEIVNNNISYYYFSDESYWRSSDNLYIDGSLRIKEDGASLSFGDDHEVILKHVHNTGLRLNSSNKFAFRNNNTYINSESNGYLNICSNEAIIFEILGVNNLEVTQGSVKVNSDIFSIQGLTFTSNDITFSNGESIGNNTDGVIEIISPITKLSGDLLVSGNDITFDNGESISNATNGTIAITATKTKLSGDLTVTGNDITFGNGESISNATNGTIAITATTTKLSGDLTVTGNDITFGNGESISNSTDGTITIDASITELSGDLNIDGDLNVDGDLTVTGNTITFGNEEVINNSTDGIITITATTTKLSGDLKIIGNDITFGNGESISNSTNGIIEITATTTNLSGDLIVTGNDLTFGNGESISNATNNIITITAATTKLSGDLIVTGNDITFGNEESISNSDDGVITINADTTYLTGNLLFDTSKYIYWNDSNKYITGTSNKISIISDDSLVFSTETLDIDASGNIAIDSLGEIQIGSNTAAGNISIGDNETARTITIGNAIDTTTINIESGSGGINIDATGDKVYIDSDTGVSIGTNEDKPIIIQGSSFDVDISGLISIDSSDANGCNICTATPSIPVTIGTSSSSTTIGGNLVVNGNFEAGEQTIVNNLSSNGYVTNLNTSTLTIEDRKVQINISDVIFIDTVIEDPNDSTLYNFFGNSSVEHELSQNDYVLIQESNLFTDSSGEPSYSINGVRQIYVMNPDYTDSSDQTSFITLADDYNTSLTAKTFNPPRYIGVNGLDDSIIYNYNTDYQGSSIIKVLVYIDDADTPSFIYSLNGGYTWQNDSVAISTSETYYLDDDSVSIDTDPDGNGIQIFFAQATGFTVGDMWEFDCCASVNNVTDIDAESSTGQFGKVVNNFAFKDIGIELNLMDSTTNTLSKESFSFYYFSDESYWKTSNNLYVNGYLRLIEDNTILSFGADNDVTLTHVPDTGLLLNSGMQIQFGDSGEYITGDGTDLNIVSSSDLNLDCTDSLTLNSSSGVLAIGNDNVDVNIDIGTNGSRTIQIGSSSTDELNLDSKQFICTVSDSLTLTNGTGSLNFDGNGAITMASTKSIEIGTDNTESITLEAESISFSSSQGFEMNSSSAIGIGTNDVDEDVNIGTDGERSISIGTSSGTESGVYTTSISLTASDITLSSDDSLNLNSASGLIGIGTDDVDQNINIGTDGIRTITVGQVNSNKVSVKASNIELATAGNIKLFSFDISAPNALYVGSSNEVTTTASDRRLKENIQTISNGLEIVNQLNPVSYRWKDNKPKAPQNINAYGFIAQDIRDVLPNAALGEESENKYMNFDDRSILSYNTKAIQELYIDNQNMKSELVSLRSENDILKSQISEIFKKLDKANL